MTTNLLISTSTVTTLLIVAAVIFGLSSFLYGVLRKFTQMSWLCWQIPLVLLLTLIIGQLPENMAKETRLTMSLAIVAGGATLILGLGGIIRYSMLKRKRPAPAFFRFLNRLLGGITALLSLATFVLFLAAPTLAGLYYIYPVEALSAVWENAFFLQVLPYLFDFFLVALILLAIRTGWRVGFGKMIVVVLLCLLSAGALVLSVYLAVGPFKGASLGLAANMGGSFGAILGGYAIMWLITFVVLFIVVCIIGSLLNKLMRHIRFSYFWGTIDGIIFAAIMLAIMLAVVFAVNMGVIWLSSGTFMTYLKEPEENIVKIGDSIIEWSSRVEALLRSSALSRIFYDYNPFVSIA